MIYFGVGFFTNFVGININFQMEYFIINLELYNSRYDLKTEGGSNSTILDRFY